MVVSMASTIFHFVLVHGLGHGSWCWYKLIPLLEFGGHNVTALDMTASGINLEYIEDVLTFSSYTKPLLVFLESLPSDKNVILVGHSLGGINLAFAMEYYPEKILATIFVAAFRPDITHKPSYVIEKSLNGSTTFPNTEYITYGPPGNEVVALLFGAEFLNSTLYNQSPEKDLKLALTLVRFGSRFLNDLSKEKKFTQRYESVPRSFIKSLDDLVIPLSFQNFMIENNPVEHELQVNGSDHMVMLSKPNELSDAIMQIASYYTPKNS
ncbi:(R)-mandelonitrile lyase [Sarracenia purpurea var. burkii]